MIPRAAALFRRVLRRALPCCLALCAVAAVAQPAEKVDVDTLLARVRHAYRIAPAYRSQGTVTSHIIEADKGRETTLTGTFTLQLGRPRLYRIAWSQKVDPLPLQQGAVWNAGEGPRLLLPGADACSMMSEDRPALAAAAGVSMGITHFVPHLFFDLGQDADSLAQLDGAAYETEAEVEGRPCHLVRATLSDTIAVRLWIDRSTYEIRRIEKAFGGSPKLDLSPEAEAEALKAAGREVNEENRRALRAALAEVRASLGNVRGRTIQEHRAIDLVGVPDAGSYDIELPEGTAMVEGLAPASPAEETP